MLKLEQKLTTRFQRWMRATWETSALVEIKVCTTPSFPFGRVLEHQELALKLAKHKKLVYKIPDEDRRAKPADVVCFVRSEAYIVIFFYIPRGDINFVMIDIDDWIKHKAGTARKSITFAQACLIGKHYKL